MSKLLIVVRLLAAAPLLGIGIQHITGAAPMLPILEGAGFPQPELGAQFAPMIEVLAGGLLLLGLFARLGALLALGSMAGAVYAHLNFDWEGEPSIALPVGVIVCAAIVLVAGPGSMVLGKRSQGE